MRKLRQFALICCFALLLSACGGGNKGGDGEAASIPPTTPGEPPGTLPEWPVDALAARTLAGGSAPPDMQTTIESHLLTLGNAADSLVMSDVLLVFGTGDPMRIEVSCDAGESCGGSYAGGEVEFEPGDLADGLPTGYVGEWQAVMTYRGATLFQSRGSGRLSGSNFTLDLAATGFGGWLAHSYFAVEGGMVQETTPFPYGASYSVGDATGSNPAANLSWAGVMVGIDASKDGATRGNPILGDAALSFDASDTTLDVSFTNVRDLSASTTRADITLSDLTVSGGIFGKDEEGEFIRGSFYGDAHAEAGGVFEKDGVLGAFGAKKTN